MVKVVDDLLNKITMYRLVLYLLIILILISLIFSILGLLPFGTFAFIASTLILVSCCYSFNLLFSKLLNVPSNFESALITPLILSLIITPSLAISNLLFLVAVSAISMGSKYILAINKKHIFNPAAVAVAATLLLGLGGASWWIGNTFMLFAVIFVGLLILRKIKRFLMAGSFLIAVILSTGGFSVWAGSDFLLILQDMFLVSPLLFFAFVMLTEPQTSPTTRIWQIIYGAGVGLLYGSVYFTPEQALLIGNILAFLVNPRVKEVLKLKQKIEIGPNIYFLLFKGDRKINFKAGQFLEWTLKHENFDTRGVRRFFTIASSPTEEGLGIGVKFNEKGSSFKQKLLSLKTGDEITVSGLGGDFTLPKDASKKLVFIAGGIGATPFRSMIKYLLDKNEKRDITLFYSAKTKEEFVFKEIFNAAQKELGIKVIYKETLKAPLERKLSSSAYETGILDKEKILKEVPDFKDRTFYISGPPPMVDAFCKTLSEMGLSSSQIKTDYFPGYS